LPHSLLLSSFSSLLRRPLRYTLFPYTTLFRSPPSRPCRLPRLRLRRLFSLPARGETASELAKSFQPTARSEPGGGFLLLSPLQRSEEHTSELQSRFDLVCRLLLEKKKVKIN